MMMCIMPVGQISQLLRTTYVAGAPPTFEAIALGVLGLQPGVFGKFLGEFCVFFLFDLMFFFKKIFNFCS